MSIVPFNCAIGDAPSKILPCASTVALAPPDDSVDTNKIIITGHGTITSFGPPPANTGVTKQVTFEPSGGSIVLTHSAPSLVLLGAATRTIGTVCIGVYSCDTSGHWTEESFADTTQAPGSGGGGGTAGVSSWNSRTGAVTMTLADITGIGGAPIASPGFSGSPSAPTPTAGNSTTQLATTAFVGTAIANAAVPAPSSTTPAMDGVGAAGSAAAYARGDHVHPSDTTKANLVSPTFTGAPSAPTAAPGTGTTQLATCAFVGAAITATGLTPSSTTPAMDGVGAAGSATTYSRGDHVHPSDTSRAPLVSPGFSGNPTAPTPATADSSTTLATTAFVKAQGYQVNNATITLSGDISGSGSTAITTTLATVNANVGTFQGITVNGKGLVTGAVNMNYAPLANPAFTGSPTAPTAAALTNTTQLATTAYADAAVAVEKSRAQTAEGLLAPLASPTFTGSPAAPTATAGTATTQLATTAFVGTALTNAAVPAPSSATPSMNGTGAAGTATAYSRGDHVHPTDTTRAPLASPVFTGTVTLAADPTSALQAATKQYVDGHAGGTVYIADTPPTGTPAAGALWWESDTGALYIYYTDANGSQWVLAAPPSGAITNAVRFDTAQSLNATQQQQAQKNIGPLVGVTDGSAAAAGQIGECITSYASGVAAGASGSVQNITSITLTPGDWDVSAIGSFLGAPITFQQFSVGLSTTSATMPSGAANTGLVNNYVGPFQQYYQCGNPIAPYRFSVTVNTIIYLCATITYNAGSGSFNGRIQARRMR
jgi:hypothetical protein